MDSNFFLSDLYFSSLDNFNMLQRQSKVTTKEKNNNNELHLCRIYIILNLKFYAAPLKIQFRRSSYPQGGKELKFYAHGPGRNSFF